MIKKLHNDSKNDSATLLLRNVLFSLNFFINIFKNNSFTDVFYEIRSHERGVAQIASVGAIKNYILFDKLLDF